MPRFMFVGDIIEANGKTWRENNLAIPHNIPIGTLVELSNGVRAFVKEHSRDCDGSLLYSIGIEEDDRNLSLEFARMSWSGGYSEKSLTVVKRK